MRFNADVYNQLDEGERSLVDWQYHMGGHFNTALWELICRADENNLLRISASFPMHVRAYHGYAHTEGWWPDLQKRLIIQEKPNEAVDQGNP